MAALGDVLALTGARTREVAPLAEARELSIELPSTVDATDTFTLDLTRYGATRLTGILGFDHTTDGSVVVTVAPTTTVSAAGVLTVTVGAGGDNRTRAFIIWIR